MEVVHVVDFETESIEARPAYPPVPVGVSILESGSRKAEYLSWGHPTKNNCTKEQARARLLKLWKGKIPILFHNAKFDIDVAETHLGMPKLKWDMFHDTLFMLFLTEPHADTLSLKPSAERILGIAPDEQDKLKDWIVNNVVGATEKNFGKFIAQAPGDIVGRYANGDVTRTYKLYKKLYPKIIEEHMSDAYDRERKLLPVFLENERIGLRVDIKRLQQDIVHYKEQLTIAEEWLRKRLKVKEINFDSDASVANILDHMGIVKEWAVTKTGKKSTSKKTMTIDKFTDKKVFLVLGYRNRLTTCLRMFMEPWFEQAYATGFIQPTWNQVRQPKGDSDTKGTRTGRPSCDNPNVLNLSKSFEDRGDDYTHPTFTNLTPLPLVRKYILPDKGCVWLHRDYNQQELRLLAHFEDGKLKQAYCDDPRLDVHTFVQEAVKNIVGKLFDRVSIKTTVFGRVYGQGVGGLAERLRVPVEQVKQIRDAQNKALPGLPAIDKSIKDLAKNGDPIVTWGGRVYYVEPPKYVEKFGREMTFEYKLLNYLIQGSAADCTKEAIIRFHYSKKRKPSWRFIVTVYDEINICAPKGEAKAAMALLKECMESIEIDVPMLSDGKIGPSWGDLKKE